MGTAGFWSGMTDALPLQVREIEADDPLVTIFGEGWSLNLACPWDLVTPHRIIGWEDPRLEDEVWNLIGLSLRAAEPCPDGNPRFAFEASYRIEVHADTAVDPWVLRTPDCTFVGRAAGTPDTGSSALAVVRDRPARTVSRRLGR